ncbi:bifunctional AfsR/SARP family transcriptional regulator/alpha/beta hydrolase [Haliea sp.]
MPDLCIKLLGAPRIVRDGSEVTPRRRKTLSLLAYLVTEPRLHARTRLALLLWPDAKDARKLLRHAVYELKKCLGDDALVGHRDNLGIDKAVSACSDLIRLQRLADGNDEAVAAAALAEVETLCSGEFLEGMVFDDCKVMADWHYAMREMVARCRVHLLARQVAAYRAHGNIEIALSLLGRWQRLDRLDEGAHQQLIELHLQRNEPRQAEQVFERYKASLYEELGVAPSSALTELVASMRTGLPIPAPGDCELPPPQTRYQQSGSVFIAYQILGAGPVTLVVVNGFMSHLEQMWENPELAYFLNQLATQVRLVLFDKRGCGMSDRVAEAPTPGDIADDIYCLVTVLNLERVALFGFSEGGAAAIEFVARYPKLAERLILYGTAAKWTQDPSYRPALTPQQFDVWQVQLLRSWGRGVSIGEFAPSQARDPAVINWWAKTMRVSSSPGEVRKILHSIRDIDVRPRLADIHCPTHILHKIEDRVVRFEAAEYLAQGLPNARLTPLGGRDHWFWTEEPDRVLALIRDDLNGVASAKAKANS